MEVGDLFEVVEDEVDVVSHNTGSLRRVERSNVVIHNRQQVPPELFLRLHQLTDYGPVTEPTIYYM